MSSDEKLLLQRIAGGDEIAFKEFFTCYYPKVIMFLLGLIDNLDEVKDLSQNIFVKLWLMRSSLLEIRSLKSYMYRMSRNAALDYCRKHRINIPLSETYEETEDLVNQDFFARETMAQMERRVDSMPEKRREVFRLSRMEGLSNQEISDRLGISRKTVENHINAALRELRKISSCIAVFL